MKWESEKWRKLYRRVDATWLKLPVLARGLGSELLKYADDDGRVALQEDEETGEGLCRIMSAHKAERKLVSELVQKLLADGYIVREEGGIFIRNFVRAQARSSNAERQARYRERHAAVGDEENRNVDVPVTVDPVSNVTSNAPSNAEVTPRVTPALPNEVTDRALPLSEISSDSSFLTKEDLPVTAGARDSKSGAKSGEQGALWVDGSEARPRRRGVDVPIPDGWAPSPAHFEKGRELGLSDQDVRAEASKFRSDALAKDKRFVRWGQAFNTWLTNAAEYRQRRSATSRPQQSTARDGCIAEITHE